MGSLSKNINLDQNLNICLLGKLYYEDNLEVLRGHVLPKSVSWIYFDPSFNSNVNYDVIFKIKNWLNGGLGGKTPAEITEIKVEMLNKWKNWI